MNSKLETDQNVAEVISIIKGVKKHLQEEGCSHSINSIVKEALGRTNSAQQPTTENAPIAKTNRNEQKTIS